ncbi:xanthine dehydrogenase family protein molybdopterin-binding subunit [Blastococcus sp. CT_GayMR19]|uniref:xanthine dehydrogenase family protein molybdopterin-binding subunit n=1 Tax=Blastococcus sp. CT_GayMR19 TaxID=2559608 RepID=UPI00142F87CE|nr:xanthine dehydrogenase family protein molybdopterin-binding subunit [Blastococcus sp. CT_GayMR19]
MTVQLPFSRPEVRHEGHLKVTGSAKYTGDHYPPGLLHVACLSSPHAHALIRGVDTSGARDLPGVHAVLTGADIGDVRFGRFLRDLPVLATDRVRFIGQRVAAVAAETREAAEEAVRLIDVEYEDIPAVYDPREALTADAPVLHPEAAGYLTMRGDGRELPEHLNLQGDLVAGRSEEEMASAFAAADRVFEHTFRTPRQHQGYIEPHGAVVWFEGDTCHVISTNKAPFTLRAHLATATGHPAEQIVVYNRFIGGDFGGKGFSLDEFVAFYLARATGRPVRSVMSYVEELSGAGPRHAAELTLRTAVSSDGIFLAHSADVVFDGGAYAAGKAAPDLVPHGGLDTMSAYSIAATRHRLRTVYTNSVPGGHMRAPGEVQAVFAGETHVDLIAGELGLDPVELRRRNLLRPGSPAPDGTGAQSAAGEVLSRAAEGVDWATQPTRGRGTGIAVYRRKGGAGRGGVVLRALAPDRFEIVTGAADQGAGTVTMIARVAATALGVDESCVEVVQQPTAVAMFDQGAGASRVTRVLGEAARLAALDMRDVLAGDVLAGAVPAGAVPACAVEFPVEVTREAEAPRGEASDTFGAVAVEVEVDELTGQITVVRAALAADTGTVINPLSHRGQLEGGFAFGLGAALMEELPVEDGQVLAGSLGDYKLPTAPDMPPLTVINVGDTPGPGPFGAKPVGEFGNLGVAPAIGNAVARAVGVRLQQLPLPAEAVWAGLAERA